MSKKIQITECPRDAMQGIIPFIPTQTKIEYLDILLNVGFDTLDFGSFVSPKAIPQMQDTAEVLEKIQWQKSKTKLLAIIANEKGADQACSYEAIEYLGFPFSISEVFQKKNTNAGTEEALIRLDYIQNKVKKSNKKLCVYLSMAFGNPYGETWHEDIVMRWADRLNQELEVQIISLADTIGSSNPKNIQSIFSLVCQELEPKGVKIGAHLHTLPLLWEEKIEALIQTPCTWIDGALKGYGGCPMAKEELTGNMPTEKIIHFLSQKGLELQINKEILKEAIIFAEEKVFSI